MKSIVSITFVGLIVLSVSAHFISQINYIGHGDSANYGEVAENLILGRGFVVDYIAEYFVHYPSITHPEDTWAPLLSIVLVPFFIILGKTAFAAKLPTMIIGFIFIPLVTYFLGKEIFNKKIGLFSALLVLFNPIAIWGNLVVMPDKLFTLLVLLSVLFLLKGLANKKYFYLMGVSIGVAYLCKGTGLLLFPAFILFYLLTTNFRPKDKAFFWGIFIGIVVMSPWLIRNYMLFGDPFFSLNKYFTYFLGYIPWGLPWEEAEFQLYWDKPKPSLAGLIETQGLSGIFEKTLFQVRVNQLQSHLPPLFLTSLVGLMATIQNKKTYIVWILWAFFSAFFSIVWYSEHRFFYPLLPMFIILSWAGFFAVLEKLPSLQSSKDRSRLINILAVFSLLLMVSGSAYFIFGNFFNDQSGYYPYHENKEDIIWMDAAYYLKNHTPNDAVIMTRNPWELHFYSERRAIQIPYEDLATILLVAKEYNATHIVYTDLRPALKPIIENKIDGFELIYDEGLKIYEIKWSKIGSIQ